MKISLKSLSEQISVSDECAVVYKKLTVLFI